MPSVGWPAKGSSIAGVKIRIRTSASALRRQHEDGLGEVHLLRQRLHRQRVEIARVGEDGELVPGERDVGEDVGDDVAEAPHFPTLTIGSWQAEGRLAAPLGASLYREVALVRRGQQELAFLLSLELLELISAAHAHRAP